MPLPRSDSSIVSLARFFLKSGVAGCLFLGLSGCGQGIGRGFDVARTGGDPVTATGVYTVVTGDTVYAISRKTGVAVATIIAENGLVEPYRLSVGQTLRIGPAAAFQPTEPAPTAPAAAGSTAPRTHTVLSGETAYGIARGYGVSVADLASENALGPEFRLHTGQRLIIPAGTDGGAPVQSGRSPGLSAGGVTPEPGSVDRSTTAFSQAVGTGPGPDAPIRSGSFLWPVSGEVIAGFGKLGARVQNDGINIAAALNTPVQAAEHGVVAYVGNEIRGYGNLVLLRHGDGYTTAYAHLDAITVANGATVRKGEILGRVGATGGVARPQLHFEIRSNGKPVDPLSQLDR